MLILLLVSIIPMTIIQMINYLSLSNTMKGQVDNLLDASLKQVHSAVDSELKTYQSLLADICSNEDVFRYTQSLNTWDPEYQFSQRAVREYLNQVSFAKENILGIVLIAHNGESSYYDRVTLSAVESFCFNIQKLRTDPLYLSPLKHPEEIYMRTDHIESHDYQQSKNVLYLSKGISDYQSLHDSAIGTVILCIDESGLSNTYLSTKQSESDIIFVIDRDGNVLSSSEEELLNGNIYSGFHGALAESVEHYVHERNFFPKKSLVVKSYLAPNSNYSVITARTENQMINQVYSKGTWIILIGLVSILIASLIINYTANNINHAVAVIINSMRQANKGDLDVQIQNDGKDEFAQISQNFNIMISEMKQLISQEHQALNRKRKAEIKALEAQINPHFLYNTLDSINWLAIEHEQFEISKMLKYLAISLRYSINNSNAVVTLREELEYLRKYVYVQQNRFKYSFLCLIHAPEEIQDYRIHKLLMQPLIENSIEHAFPSPTGQDKIDVSICLIEPQKLQIVVSDNGIGMDEALIEELNQFDCEADSIKSNIGIRNVLSRVKIYYGDQGSFFIQNNPDSGVRIILTIPYEN